MNVPIGPQRKLIEKEEQELVRLVRKAIDDDDLKAKRLLEQRARQYQDIDNALVSFQQAFSQVSEEQRKRFQSSRISYLYYQEQMREIEDEEAIILEILMKML